MDIVIIIGIVAAVGYYISLRIHPLTKCRVCNGGGSVYTYAQRRCRKCGGTGRRDRLGVKLFK
jgi:DnaJ-class molecular chaperone